MNSNISERKALLLLLLVSFVWGAGFFVTDIALRSFTTFQMLTIRFLIGATLLNFIFKIKFKQISKYEIRAGIVCGLLLAVAFIIQVYGQYFSTPSISAFITVAYVVLVPILSKFFFNKHISKTVFVSACLILFGIFVITIGTFGKSIIAINMNLGILLTTICAIAYAFQVIAVEYYSQSKKEEVKPINLTICMLWTAFFVCLVFTILSYFIFNEKFIYSENTLSSFLAIIYLGMFSTAFAFLGQNYAQKYTQASKAAIILSLESVFGALLSALFLKEQFSFYMIIGFIIVFIAVLLTELSSTLNKN